MQRPFGADGWSTLGVVQRWLSWAAVTAIALAGVIVLPGTVLSGAAGAEANNARGGSRADKVVVASFNVLGHSHTKGPHGRRGFANSHVRLALAIKALRRTHVGIVGFQELQHPQYHQFLRQTARTGERWGVFPGSPRDTDNTIAWRRSRFRLVRGWRVGIPYFHGNVRPMPVVELRSRATGRHLYVMNVHNPADVRGNAAHWRRIAVARERRVTTQLTRRHKRAPVLLTGDMNDRAAFFCAVTANHVMHSFLGGSHRHGRCHAPRSGVDWILGNRHVSFRSHRINRSKLVSAATDHPLVSAHVRMGG